MRKVKDAKEITTGEKIYFKGHAKATYMSDGRTVEDAINQAGIGGGSSSGESSSKEVVNVFGATIDRLEPNKIYIYELKYKNGDYVQYTFSTFCK